MGRLMTTVCGGGELCGEVGNYVGICESVSEGGSMCEEVGDCEGRWEHVRGGGRL